MLDGIVQRRNHIADVAFARAIQNLQHDEAGGRSDTRSRAAGIEAIAGDDPGNVRAVAVVVVGLLLTLDEIHEANHARRAVGIFEVVV